VVSCAGPSGPFRRIGSVRTRCLGCSYIIVMEFKLKDIMRA
jgi:hypothetical protein